MLFRVIQHCGLGTLVINVIQQIVLLLQILFMRIIVDRRFQR